MIDSVLDLYSFWIYNVYTEEVFIMYAQVKSWGNSQGIRIPKGVLSDANIFLDDMLEVKVSDGAITLVK